MRSFKIYLVVPGLLMFNFSMAQNYQAINGSSYAGSLGPGNNPASIVHVPYAWDITPFSVQLKQSTNAYTIKKFSLLSSPNNAELAADNGDKKRFFFANQDIRLLNTRVSLNSKAAIAFGVNVRSYVYGSSSESSYLDTIHSMRDFMKINGSNLPLSAEVRGSAWAEVYATYSQTIIEEDNKLLNAGITFKVSRGLAGGYGKAQGLSYIPAVFSNAAGYSLTRGSLQYGYSYNFDFIDSNKSTSANTNIFLEKTYSSVAADIGLEYILLSPEDKEEGGDYAYNTKIGISIMDIGWNKYRNGTRSRLAIAGKAGISDTLIERKFSSVSTFDHFNDSLTSISNSIRRVRGDFLIYQPTRIMINLDQHIVHNFFINTEITIPIISLIRKNGLYLKDMNLLAITPRWEIKALGAYFPILLNTKNQLWVGGAFKAGPLLFGTHNLANLFSKNTFQSGGLYLALTIRPGKNYDRQAHYPKTSLFGKEKKNLHCPRF